jgi:hypothetical protein
MTRLLWLPLILMLAVATAAGAASPSRTPLYYQAPDGAPYYAAGPSRHRTARDYVPVFEIRRRRR